MERKIFKELYVWFETKELRKPLIIRGARQVGKTWLVRHLAKKFNLELLELNFEQNPHIKSFFQDNEPKKIITRLETFFSKTINLKTCLLFLDEIQAAPELFAKLRWFAEDMPELAVIATGSLLDFMLEEYEYSVPVGRVQFLHLEPMSFEEFLLAIGQKKLCDFLGNYKLSETIPILIHERLQQFLRDYIFIGGMPEAVEYWSKNSSTFPNQQILTRTKEIQFNILATFRDDFSKYAKRLPKEHLEEVFNAVPLLLGKKFKYSSVNKDIQSINIKNALNLLCKAKVCHKIQACSASGIPLAATIKKNIFKVIMMDIGLVTAVTNILTKTFYDTSVIKGGITEQLVGQILRTLPPKFIEPELFYWVREEPGSEAEIDYIIQFNDAIIPIEVKSGSTGTLRSLHLFMKEKKLIRAVRINSDLPSITNVDLKDHTGTKINYKLLSIPVYFTEQLYRLLENQN